MFDKVWEELGVGKLDQDTLINECREAKALEEKHCNKKETLKTERDESYKEIEQKYKDLVEKEDQEYAESRRQLTTFCKIESLINDLIKEYDELQLQKSCQAEIDLIAQKAKDMNINISHVLANPIGASTELLTEALQNCIIKIHRVCIIIKDLSYIFDDDIHTLLKRLEKINETHLLSTDEEKEALNDFFPEPDFRKPILDDKLINNKCMYDVKIDRYRMVDIL